MDLYFILEELKLTFRERWLCFCGEYLQKGAVYDTVQQNWMKIKPGHGLTALSLSVCSGPCLSLAPGSAYDSSQFHHGFWGFGMLGFKWQVCALLLPTSGFQRLLSFLDSKSASPPSYDDYIFMAVSSCLRWYFGLLTIQLSLIKHRDTIIFPLFSTTVLL